MKFYVRFNSRERAAVDVHSRSAGLIDVDAVRDRFGSIPLESIDDVIPGLWVDPEVAVEEALARMSGHFLDNVRVTVTVPEASLNWAVKVCPVQGDDGSIQWKTWIDGVRVVKAWAEDGFPLRWDPRR